MTFSTLLSVGMAKLKLDAGRPAARQQRGDHQNAPRGSIGTTIGHRPRPTRGILKPFQAAQIAFGTFHGILIVVSIPPDEIRPLGDAAAEEEDPPAHAASPSKAPKMVRSDETPVDMATGKPHRLSKTPPKEYTLMCDVKAIKADLKQARLFADVRQLETDLKKAKDALETYRSHSDT